MGNTPISVKVDYEVDETIKTLEYTQGLHQVECLIRRTQLMSLILSPHTEAFIYFKSNNRHYLFYITNKHNSIRYYIVDNTKMKIPTDAIALAVRVYPTN